MIDQLKNGNKAALKKAYELYSEKVYHVAYSYTRQSDAAKDIVQDVFIKLWKNRSKISEVHSLDHQLFVITKNMLHDHFRRSVLEEKVLANFKDLITVAESEDNSVCCLPCFFRFSLPEVLLALAGLVCDMPGDADSFA